MSISSIGARKGRLVWIDELGKMLVFQELEKEGIVEEEAR
jgi:hypothetical protein